MNIRTVEGRQEARRMGKGMISAVGEYTPSEFWDALDYIEELEHYLALVRKNFADYRLEVLRRMP